MSAFSSWAPGRVNLIGEHTDYSGGLVLPVAIDRGVTLSVESVGGDTIALTSDGYGTARAFSADGRDAAVDGWGRYAVAVAAELAELGRSPVGLAGTLTSNLPIGSGLSSSAALEVAIGLALCEVASFGLPPMELAAACQRAELRAVGVPCGILDQAASILGREGQAILLDCGTLEHSTIPISPEAGFVVIDSGVEHGAGGSHADSGYADRRRELETAMAAVGATRSTAIPMSALDRLDGVSLRRLRHVLTENERVLRFRDALSAGDLVTAGATLSESHASLRDDYEVSVPPVDRLVELANDHGALGARQLGGGFGGSVLVLVEAGRSEAVGRAIGDAYARELGFGGGVLAVRASAGAVIER
jgi:galactokinase